MSVRLRVRAIAAMDEGRVIGKGNQLPWHLPADLKRFSELTTGHTVLMGRNTFQSLPDKFRPLPNRKNVVISRTPGALQLPEGVERWDSPLGFIEAVESAEVELPSNELWIIGGEQIYRNTVRYWDELFLTLVKGSHEGDVFFPQFENRFTLSKSEEHEQFTFQHYLANHLIKKGG